MDTLYLESLKKTLGYLRLIGNNRQAEKIVDTLITNRLQVLTGSATISTHVHTKGERMLTKPDGTMPLFTVNGIAKYLGFSRGTIYNLVRTGQLKVTHIRAGRKVVKRFRPEDVELYLQELGKEIVDDNTED